MALSKKSSDPDRQRAADLRYHLTAQFNLIDVAKCLDLIAQLKNTPSLLDIPDENKRTPLYQAARKGKLAIVEALLARGADVNCLSLGQTPLMAASMTGHLEITRKLVEAGADVNVVTAEGQSALQFACRFGYDGCAEILLAAGAKTERRCAPNGFTPLMTAAAAGYPYAVEKLLAAGADIAAVSDSGATPLMLAAHHGEAAVVKVLLANGAPPALRDKNGRTALDYARKKNETGEATALLQEAVAKIERHIAKGLPLTEDLPVGKKVRLRPRKSPPKP